MLRVPTILSGGNPAMWCACKATCTNSEKQIKGNRANYCRDQNMTIWFYVKTNDSPTSVGEVVCNFNFIQGEHPEDKYSYIMEKGKGEMYRLSSSNLIRKGLARVHLFVLSLRYRSALCFTRHGDKTGPTFLWMPPNINFSSLTRSTVRPQAFTLSYSILF